MNDSIRNNNDVMHGVTLELLLIELQATFGWAGLYEEVEVRCFDNDPSIKSSLKFLRRTPWAREKVEAMYFRYKTEP